MLETLHKVYRDKTGRLPALACGAILVLLGLRETIPALIVQPHSSTIEAIQDFQEAAPDALDGLIDAEQTALALHETPQSWSTLGLALLLRSASSAEPHPFLEKAHTALVSSLELAPANPYVWTRLASVDQLLNASPNVVLDDWRMAYMTGPNEDRLRSGRIKLAVDLWPQLNAGDRANVLTDIRSEWHDDRDRVLADATDTFSTNLVRAALVTDLPELLSFEKLRSEKKPKQ